MMEREASVQMLKECKDTSRPCGHWLLSLLNIYCCFIPLLFCDI